MTITVSNNKPTIFSKFISSGQQIYLNQASDFNSEKILIQSIMFSDKITTIGDISNL